MTSKSFTSSYVVESELAAYPSMVGINFSVDEWELNANVG